MLIYTTVSAGSMAAVLRLANRGVRHMVLFAVDDDPWFFRELVERIPAYPVVDLMMDELRVSLALLPQRVTRAIQLLFESPTRAHTSTELAQLAGLTRRSLYRLMSPAGLQPRKVVDCAHLLRAYTLLSVPGSRLKETSTRLGFAAPQTLTDLLREWTGHTTRTIQRGVPPGTFVRLLSNTLYEGIAPALTESVGSVAQAS